MRGAVAAGHPLTAEAGARVLAEGGNAVDACVAAAFVSWVAESTLTGPGAGGFMLVHQARDRSIRLLDHFVTVPGLGLPRDVIHRPKQGFGAPVGAWLRGPLRDTARDCLLAGLPARGVIDPATVRRTWIAHEQGDGRDATRLWILLCLELWFRRCVDARAGTAARASA